MSAKLPDSRPVNRGVNREHTKRFDWSLNNTVAWEYTFLEKHRTVITLAQEAEQRNYWQDRIEARNINPSDALGFHNTANGTKENGSVLTTDEYQTADALLARLFYSFDDKYMLTASIRRDGYSAFGHSNPYAVFPSVAVGWTFTNEDFFVWKEIMNSGKLRISWGENGNRDLSSPYLALANLGSGTGRTMGYITNSGMLDLKYLGADRLANPNLQWEKTSSWNFGLDFGFLKDRITGSIEYYSMSTHDMIMSQPLPNFSGFSSITTNLGEVTNKGIEISINSINIQNEKLTWSTSLSFSYNKNEIKHLFYEYDENGKEMDYTSARGGQGWHIGQPINVIWDYNVTGIWQVDEYDEARRHGQRPGDPKVANNYTEDDRVNSDGTTTPVYNDKDKEFLGQTTPPIHWQMRNDFTFFKSWNFAFNIYSYMGHKSRSGNYLNRDNDGDMVTQGWNQFAKEYWTPENPTNKYGRLDAQGPAGITGVNKVYDRSFIRLESISIGYTLPTALTRRAQVEKAKVFGSIRNVGVWNADWEYGDPETGLLATRVFSLGLSLTF
jgi:hypothetical protein